MAAHRNLLQPRLYELRVRPRHETLEYTSARRMEPNPSERPHSCRLTSSMARSKERRLAIETAPKIKSEEFQMIRVARFTARCGLSPTRCAGLDCDKPEPRRATLPAA